MNTLLLRRFTFDALWPELRARLAGLTPSMTDAMWQLLALDHLDTPFHAYSRIAIVAFDGNLDSPLDQMPLGWAAVWWDTRGTVGVFVRPDVRRQGIGYELVADAVRLAIGLSVELRPGDRLSPETLAWFSKCGVRMLEQPPGRPEEGKRS